MYLPSFYLCDKLFERVFSQQKPLLSACVLSYRQNDTVKKAIEALLRQGDCGYEIVIMDDASDTATCQDMVGYLSTISSSDAVRIVYYTAHENCDILRNRWRAMNQAQGEWFVNVDGDDLPMKDRMPRLASLVKTLSDEVVLIATNGLMWDGSEQLPELQPSSKTVLGRVDDGCLQMSLSDYDDILSRTPVGGCGFVARRNLFERFKTIDMPYRIKGEDVVMAKRALLIGQILIDYSCYYYYFVNPQSACGSGCYNKRWIQDRIDRCEILAKDLASLSPDGKLSSEWAGKIRREKRKQELDYKLFDCSIVVWPYYWFQLCLISRGEGVRTLKRRVKGMIRWGKND